MAYVLVLLLVEIQELLGPGGGVCPRSRSGHDTDDRTRPHSLAILIFMLDPERAREQKQSQNLAQRQPRERDEPLGRREACLRRRQRRRAVLNLRLAGRAHDDQTGTIARARWLDKVWCCIAHVSHRPADHVAPISQRPPEPNGTDDDKTSSLAPPT